MRRVTLPLLMALALVLAACGGGTADDTGSETAEDTGAAEETSAEASESAEPEGSEEEGSESEGAESEAATADLAFEPMEEGVLTVGTQLPAPPFWIGDDYESIEGGYEVDIANEIANRLGLDEVVYVEMPFDGLVAGADCPCDVNFSQVTINDERAEVVDFSAPYFEANQGVLVNEGTEVATVEEAQALTWGAQLNSTGQFYVSDTLQPEAEVQTYNTVTDAFNALRAGQVDAVMLDVPIVQGEVESNPDAGFAVVGQFETGEEYGAVLALDSPNTEAVSTVIEELRTAGFLDELAAEYFGAVADVPVIEP